MRTGSLLTPQQIRELLARAADLYDCTAVEETTLEANPDDLDGPYLEALRQAGIDRLSIGIQSLDDACLRLMNRRHTAAQAREAVAAARHSHPSGSRDSAAIRCAARSTACWRWNPNMFRHTI